MWLHINIDSGDSSYVFLSSSSLLNVEWRRAAVYVHGPHFWDNNSRGQFEMVILHLNLNSNIRWNILFVDVCIVFVKVSWCSWNEKVKSLSHQRGCNLHCLAGRSCHCSLKYTFVTRCKSNLMLNSHSGPLGHPYRNGLSAGCQNTFVRVYVLPRLLTLWSGNNFWHTEFKNCLASLMLCSRQIFNMTFWSGNITTYLLPW